MARASPEKGAVVLEAVMWFGIMTPDISYTVALFLLLVHHTGTMDDYLGLFFSLVRLLPPLVTAYDPMSDGISASNRSQQEWERS